MKLLLLIFACAVLFFFAENSSNNKAKTTNNLIKKADSVNFAAHVMPLLQKKCSPCHFPGGKMYEKMPFDKATTIIQHEPGILRRINNDNEMAVVKQFLQQNVPH